jgi:hypothetical protein
MLLFALFSSFAAFIAIEVSLEGILPQHHPVAPTMFWVFWIPECHSELIHFSVKLQSTSFDIFYFVH